MRLLARPSLAYEVLEGFDCIRDWNFYDPPLKKRLAAMSRRLIQDRVAVTVSIFDYDQTFGRALVAFGIGAFVQPSVADEVRRGEHPYLPVRMLELVDRGGKPFLTRDEIGRANASAGLHFVNLHSGVLPSIMFEPEARPILNMNASVFFDGLAGHKLNEVLVEVYRQEEYEFAKEMGYFDRAPLAPALDRLGIRPASERFPFLVGTDSEEAKIKLGTLHAAMFRYSPPRLYLSELEQELLSFALNGMTDEELSELLFLSYPAVRKRWTSIYEKVGEHLPELLERGQDASAKGEKRRRVIQYIQSHREELRPYAYGKRPGQQ